MGVYALARILANQFMGVAAELMGVAADRPFRKMLALIPASFSSPRCPDDKAADELLPWPWYLYRVQRGHLNIFELLRRQSTFPRPMPVSESKLANSRLIQRAIYLSTVDRRHIKPNFFRSRPMALGRLQS